ncbi:MAG: PKD domain-containing protein [Bacteroidia bacterium]|nr:PKD domain-containing protein [Bacteroidia bacterium]
MLFFAQFARAQDISIDPKQPLGIFYCNQSFYISPNFYMVASSSVTGMRISFTTGYIYGEDELHMVGYSGSVHETWYAAQGYLELLGGSSVDDYINAIRKVQYMNKAPSPTKGDRTITFSLNDADYLPDTQHFYKFISWPGITWTSAKAEAESAAMKYHGLQGYLATITSAAENAFIQLKTKGVGWIGASDAAVEGDWKWVTGPEAGTLFWRGLSTGSAVNGMYNNWNTGEPNDCCDANIPHQEDYAHITFFPNNPAQNLRWNDLPNGGTSGNYYPAGYLVEYGGMPGDPPVNLIASVALQVIVHSFSAERIFSRCQGIPVQINQQDNSATYSWTPVAGLSNPKISNPIAKPDVSTVYTVTAINGFCRDSARFTVNIDPLPVSILKKVVDICAGNKATLDPGPSTSYLWNTGSTARSLVTDMPGKYTVKLTSDKGCTASDSAMVYVHPYPKMDLSGINKLVCGSKATNLNISKDRGEWLITNLSSKEQFSTTSIQVASFGIYPFDLKLSDSYGCVVDSLVSIGFHETTAVNLGNDTTICNPRSIILDAGPGLALYQWSGGETTRKIEVKQSGKYNVLVKNSFGCYTKDSIKVGFTDNPRLNLSHLDTLICGSKATTVNITVDKGIYQLTSINPAVQINSLSANVPAYGKYPFSFNATDQYGCRSDTSFSMGFHKIPDVKFTIDESQCYGYNLQATYIGNANLLNSRFTWIFGGDTISNKLGRNIETIPLGVGQTKRDLKLIVSDEGCANSDAIRDIHVIPTLSASVKNAVQCQPLAFEFNGFNTETGVTYLWDLGDGSFAATKDVMHSYTKDGYYDVSLTVTTDKGCTNTAAIKRMVYVAPVPTAGFSITPDLCLKPGKDTLRYVGTAGSKDTFFWDLKGFDPVEIVQSPDTTAGPFVFDLINKPKTQLSLYVVSSYGCRSATASLEVKRWPIFSFKSSVKDGCAPLLVNFQAHPEDPVDKLDFQWDFGDGNKGSGADVNNSYMVPDLTHDMRLSAKSTITGCSDSVFNAGYIVVHPNPRAGFVMDHDIVYNDLPKVSFTDQSTDAINFKWDFGDGTHSREKDPVHNYEVVGKRKIIQTVYNQFDCPDTTSKVVLVAFNKIFPPNAFSPGAANSIDRVFLLSSEGIKKEGYHLTIFSRWNDIVFECRDEIKGWDGKMANGVYAPGGSYIWILECFDFLGRPHKQSGSLTLVF